MFKSSRIRIVISANKEVVTWPSKTSSIELSIRYCSNTGSGINVFGSGFIPKRFDYYCTENIFLDDRSMEKF